MPKINPLDRFQAYYAAIGEMIDGTKDVDLLDAIGSDLGDLAKRALTKANKSAADEEQTAVVPKEPRP